MEGKDRLQAVAGKAEVQKLLEHVFYLVVPFFFHFWHIFHKSTWKYSQIDEMHPFLLLSLYKRTER